MPKKNKSSTYMTDDEINRDRQRLPDVLVEKFGHFGFVKWTSAFCPVLIVDPMELVKQKVLPEGIYHAWMYKIDLSIESEVDNEIPALIYWYGTTYEFSVVALRTVVPFEEGKTLGYDSVPDFMARRMTLEMSVPAVYQLVKDGMEILTTSAMKLAPEERSAVIVNPKRKRQVVLNEWHALSMDPPPEQHSWIEKRDRLLTRLPNSELFGTVGFLPFTKGGNKQQQQHYHPVLILSPFRVPPGPIRKEWFHKCSSKQMVLVYWFGAYICGRPQGAYSFTFLSQVINWDNGKQLGYDQLPPHVLQEYYGSSNATTRPSRQTNDASKRTVGHRLSWMADWLVCGHWELQQALKKDPRDRWGGLEDFEEDFADDFDYYWECIEAAEVAIQAKRQQREAQERQRSKDKNHAQDSGTTSSSRASDSIKAASSQSAKAASDNNDSHKKVIKNKRVAKVTNGKEDHNGFSNPLEGKDLDVQNGSNTKLDADEGNKKEIQNMDKVTASAAKSKSKKRQRNTPVKSRKNGSNHDSPQTSEESEGLTSEVHGSRSHTTDEESDISRNNGIKPSAKPASMKEHKANGKKSPKRRRSVDDGTEAEPVVDKSRVGKDYRPRKNSDAREKGTNGGHDSVRDGDSESRPKLKRLKKLRRSQSADAKIDSYTSPDKGGRNKRGAVQDFEPTSRKKIKKRKRNSFDDEEIGDSAQSYARESKSDHEAIHGASESSAENLLATFRIPRKGDKLPKNIEGSEGEKRPGQEILSSEKQVIFRIPRKNDRKKAEASSETKGLYSKMNGVREASTSLKTDQQQSIEDAVRADNAAGSKFKTADNASQESKVEKSYAKKWENEDRAQSTHEAVPTERTTEGNHLVQDHGAVKPNGSVNDMVNSTENKVFKSFSEEESRIHRAVTEKLSRDRRNERQKGEATGTNTTKQNRIKERDWALGKLEIVEKEQLRGGHAAVSESGEGGSQGTEGAQTLGSEDKKLSTLTEEKKSKKEMQLKIPSKEDTTVSEVPVNTNWGTKIAKKKGAKKELIKKRDDEEKRNSQMKEIQNEQKKSSAKESTLKKRTDNADSADVGDCEIQNAHNRNKTDEPKKQKKAKRVDSLQLEPTCDGDVQISQQTGKKRRKSVGNDSVHESENTAAPPDKQEDSGAHSDAQTVTSKLSEKGREPTIMDGQEDQPPSRGGTKTERRGTEVNSSSSDDGEKSLTSKRRDKSELTNEICASQDISIIRILNKGNDVSVDKSSELTSTSARSAKKLSPRPKTQEVSTSNNDMAAADVFAHKAVSNDSPTERATASLIHHMADSKFSLGPETNPSKGNMDGGNCSREGDASLDEAVQNSLLCCAAALKGDEIKERVDDKHKTNKPKGNENGAMKSLDPEESMHPDELAELKRRRETQEVVAKVIEEWTQRKERMMKSK